MAQEVKLKRSKPRYICEVMEKIDIIGKILEKLAEWAKFFLMPQRNLCFVYIYVGFSRIYRQSSREDGPKFPSSNELASEERVSFNLV